MPTRILIVDPDSATQRLAAQACRDQGYEVSIARDDSAGMRLWKRERPDLILLDASLPRGHAYEMASKIRAQESDGHVPIIMMTATSDVAERVKVFRSGADAHLSKPVDPRELVARIRGLLARFEPADTAAGSQPGRIIAFYGAKGGVGTTTLAINSAIALRRELQRRVALVDGRLQFGDHRIFLDLGLDRRTIVDAVTAPTIDIDLLKSVLVQHGSGVDLLLSPPTPESADLVRQDDLPKILGLLRPLYDYVLIDVESRLDEATLHILDSADSVLVVMAPDLPSVKDVRMLVETVSRLGWPSDKITLILNRATAAGGISLRGVESALERPIDYAIINDFRTAITAVNTGAPFMLTKPGSLLGRSLMDVVRAIDARRAVRLAAGDIAPAGSELRGAIAATGEASAGGDAPKSGRSRRSRLTR